MEERYRRKFQKEEDEWDRKVISDFVKSAGADGHSPISLVREIPQSDIEEVSISYEDGKWIDKKRDDTIINSKIVCERLYDLTVGSKNWRRISVIFHHVEGSQNQYECPLYNLIPKEHTHTIEGKIRLSWWRFWVFEKSKKIAQSMDAVRGEEYVLLIIKIEYLIHSLSDKLERVSHKRMNGREIKKYNFFQGIRSKLEGMLLLSQKLIFNDQFYRLEILPVEYSLLQKECPLLQ